MTIVVFCSVSCVLLRNSSKQQVWAWAVVSSQQPLLAVIPSQQPPLSVIP